MKTCLYSLRTMVLGTALIPTLLTAAICEYGEEAPSGAIVSTAVSEGERYGSISWKWTTEDDRLDIGQTFTSNDDFMLEKITLFTPGASTSELDRPFSIVIEEFDNHKPDSPRTIVATESAMLPNLSIGGKFITLTLETPVQIRSATTYGFRLVFDSATPTSVVAIRTIPGVIDDHFAYYIRHSSSDRLVPSRQNLEFWLQGTPDSQ